MIHYRNNFEVSKITSLSNLCSFRTCFVQFFAMFAMFQYDFNHNSMRSRSIFEIVNYLNNVHFVFQNEIFVVCFIYLLQMLLRCEIREIVKQWRDVDFRNFIIFSSNFETLHEIFLKNFSNKLVHTSTVSNLFILVQYHLLRIQLVKFSVYFRDLLFFTSIIINSSNLHVYEYNSMKSFDNI